MADTPACTLRRPIMSLPADEQQRLDALKRFFVLDHEVSEDEVTRLLRVTAQLYGVTYAALTLRKDDVEHVHTAYGFDAASIPEDALFCERPVGPSLPLTVADASTDERFAKNPLIHGEQGAKFYAGVPLKSTEGFTLGTLAIMDPTAQELNGEGLAMLVDLGALAEPTLNLVRAREERDRLQANLDASTTAQHQADARLQEARARIQAAEDERDAAVALLGRRDTLADSALHVAAQTLDDDDSRTDALGRIAAAAGARRAALYHTQDDGTACCQAAWHAAGAVPLAPPGHILSLNVTAAFVARNGEIPDGLAAHDFTHLAALPAPRRDGFVLFDSPQPWAEAELLALRAALLPLFAPEVPEHTTDPSWIDALDAAPLPTVFVAGLAGDILYANTAARTLLGLGDADLDGHNLPSFVAPSDTNTLTGLLAAAPHDAPPPVDACLVDASGAERYVRLHAAPITFDGQGAVQIALYDVSAQKREETALRSMVQRAETVARSKSQFMASMSHEIRSALTSILGFAEILADEADDAQQDMAETILGSSERLLQTLNSVMDMARLEAGDETPQLEAVDIMPIVEAATATFQPQADKRDLAFFVEGTGQDAFAWADMGALARVLDNLLSNAFKFTDQGGVRLRVAAEDDWVCLEVQDTGIGIDAEFIPRLFDEFQREAGESARQGSGLGLAITKRLVELMGGQIAVTSLKGQGSVFRVVLRSAPADAPPSQRLSISDPGDTFSSGDGMASAEVVAP